MTDDWGDEVAFKLRGYQVEWVEKTYAARAAGFSRLLLDAVGGSGKTSYAGFLAKEAWQKRGTRTLILENRQQLVEQTAKRFRDETGLEVDIEMGDAFASPHAPLVVASVASIAKVGRLTGFSCDHFEYLFADEAHNSDSDQFMRVMRWFHWGSESLAENWAQPKDGTYIPKACVIGITATPDPHGKKNIGNFFHKIVARYSYLDAISDGWLVGLREENIPVKVDCRAFRKKATNYGTDFRADDESAAIIPIIEELAEQIFKLAANRKTMCYLPSKECAMLMSDALNRRGLRSLYVLGECLDRDDKTDEFRNSGPGICLCLCAMYVEGTDFPDVDTIAWMRATLSPTFYKQGIYRCSRTLPGIVNDSMTAEERRAAVAASAKPWSLVISPFFVSDKINIMSAPDLFVDPSLREKMKKAPKEFTDPAKIRDFIAALEKAADKHRNRQPRTINPLVFAVQVGIRKEYVPETAADAVPPTKAELDFLLDNGISTVDIKCSGQAQQAIGIIVERERFGLASPGQLSFLLRLGLPVDSAMLIKKGQAGAIIGAHKASFRR